MALARPTQLNDLYRDVALVNPQVGEVLVRGATHWTNGAAAGMTGGPVNPKDYGAIGDNASHPIDQDDIDAHPEWLGTYAVGDQWDFVGIQEAIYAAYGPPGAPHSIGYCELNREIYIPGGKYRLNRTLFLVNAIGVVFAGAGRFSTTLISTSVDTPVLETNMVYSVIRDLMFEYQGNQPCTVATALVEWTWDGGAGTAAGLQQLSVYDCEFYGGGYPLTVGFRVARDLYQGDNIVFHNCFFASCFYAGFMSGIGTYNALNMVFDTCNFQRCPADGILTYGGNIICIAGSFQNGQLGAAEMQQGWDIRLVSSANSASSIYGCRTESRCFLHADSSHSVDVRACSVITSAPEWAASTAYVVGNIRRALVGNGNEDGRPYVCIRSGTSGASEPAWDGSSVTVDDYTARWAVYGPTAGAADWAPNTLYALGAIRKGVANFDGNDYICVLSGRSNSTEPVWSSFPAAGIADGTTAWVVFNYNVLELDNGTVENCSLVWGRVQIGQTAPVRLINNIFSRDDWLWKGAAPSETLLGTASHYNLLCGNQVVHAGGINNGTAVPYRLPTYAAELDHVEAYSHYYLPVTTPLLWTRNGHRAGTLHRAARDVGFWPPKGHYADGTNEDLSTNVAGILNALGPRHAAETANQAGTDLLLQGGLGRGTGASGRVLVRVAAPGAAGSELNLPHATVHALAIDHERVQAGVFTTARHVTQPQEDALTGMRPGDQVWNITRGRPRIWNGFTWDDTSAATIAWDPTEFGADLQAWWSLDDPATLWQDSALSTPAVADNDPLGGISDKSGNSRPLLQATAGARPRLKLALAAGLPVAQCDGAAQFLLTTTFNRYPVPNTVVLVFRSTSLGTVFSPAAPLFVGELTHGSVGAQFVFAYGANLSLSGDAATQFGTVICTYAEAASEAWLHGVRFAGALQTGGLPQGLAVGARPNGTNFGQVDFCEAFIIDRALTATEVDQVNLYTNRWGTPEPHLNG